MHCGSERTKLFWIVYTVHTVQYSFQAEFVISVRHTFLLPLSRLNKRDLKNYFNVGHDFKSFKFDLNVQFKFVV